MNPLTRDELIELGISLSPEPLIQWAVGQLAAARRHEEKFKARGVNAAYLSGIQDLIGAIKRDWRENGDTQELPPEAMALSQSIREEALAFRKEATLIAKVAFGSDPDILSTFRPGVPTGQLLSNLTKELESVVSLFRRHSSQLSSLGGTEGFIGKGERLIATLKQAQKDQDATCRTLSATVAQRCHDRGLLYDLTRKLVRIGRLEFMKSPKQAAAFSLGGLSRKRGRSKRSESRGERIADR